MLCLLLHTKCIQMGLVRTNAPVISSPMQIYFIVQSKNISYIIRVLLVFPLLQIPNILIYLHLSDHIIIRLPIEQVSNKNYSMSNIKYSKYKNIWEKKKNKT